MLPATEVADGHNSRALAPRCLLALVMIVSGVVLLWLGRGTTFSGDELYYYARLVSRGGGIVAYHGLSLGYLLAPHNGHLQAVGRLIYEALFATAGTSYFWYRLVEVVGVLLCVGLFFELARARIGAWAALAPSILLLFFGYAWEIMLWPFDLHTVYALAAGLGALLCLERPGRRRDIAACALLVVSVATIEVGLAFVAAVAVLVLLSDRRPNRLWIPAIPGLLYAAWYVWARQFHQAAYHSTSLVDLLHSIGLASGAALGSLFALNPVGTGISVFTVGTKGWPVLSVLLLAVVAVALWRNPARPFLWSVVVLALVYWFFLASADRPPDTPRYILVGAVAVLLIGAELVRGRRLAPLVVATLFVLVAVALPRNIQLLSSGRKTELNETRLVSAEAGAEQLLGDRVDPAFLPKGDPVVVARGGAGFTSITAGQYLAGARRVGPLGYSAHELIAQPAPVRDIADAVLVGAGGALVRPAARPSQLSRCHDVRVRGSAAQFPIPPSGALVGSRARSPIQMQARLFGDEGVPVGRPLRPGGWLRLSMLPSLSARGWVGESDGPVRLCPVTPGRAAVSTRR